MVWIILWRTVIFSFNSHNSYSLWFAIVCLCIVVILLSKYCFFLLFLFRIDETKALSSIDWSTCKNKYFYFDFALIYRPNRPRCNLIKNMSNFSREPAVLIAWRYVHNYSYITLESRYWVHAWYIKTLLLLSVAVKSIQGKYAHDVICCPPSNVRKFSVMQRHDSFRKCENSRTISRDSDIRSYHSLANYYAN